MRTTLFVAALAGLASAASADVINIGVHLDGPETGQYQLTGQSALFKSDTSGVSTGGQLDNLTSGDSSIGYEEVFPPATLDGYLNFGYLGRINTLDDNDQILDTSFVMAFRSGEGVGHRIGDYLPDLTEAQLVLALGSFDTPEFFQALDYAIDNDPARGVIAVDPIGRPGDTLILVAFIGGDDGDLGVQVGTLTYTVVAPAPGAASLIAGSMLLVGRRRR